MYYIDLSWVWVDTIGMVNAAKEIDGLSLHVCFLWIEHQVIFAGNLHEISKAGVIFCLSVAMDSDVVCDSDTSLAFFKDLIHLLLEDVLGTDQAKGKSWYLLKGLLKAVSKLESQSRMTDQYP